MHDLRWLYFVNHDPLIAIAKNSDYSSSEYTIETISSLEVANVIAFGHFEFRLQTVHMYFGIIDQLQCHKNTGNIA